jgi:hypothetical protein
MPKILTRRCNSQEWTSLGKEGFLFLGKVDQMTGPKMERAVIVLDDKQGRGNIVIEAIEPQGPFQMWLELEDIPGKFWEEGDRFPTLTKAREALTAIIEINCQNDFYYEG